MKSLVSIIILNKNNYELLSNCVYSILKNSNYNNYKIIIADTGSDPDVLKNIKTLCIDNNIKLIVYDSYHFEKINNDIVKNYIDNNTKYVLFCNNDIKFITDCITEMVDTFENNLNVGTVGAVLYYGNESIQHKGIFCKIENSQLRIGHNDLGLREGIKSCGDATVLGNTAALQLVSIDVLKLLNYFPETYIDSLSDVEFNLSCLKNGYKNILCGKALAFHFESQTRQTGGKILLDDFNTLTKFIEQNEIRSIL
jgi:GT2 family glycosyltransferase